MRQLLLMRHGQAEAAHPGLVDEQRALTARGRVEVQQAAHCIAASALNIDYLLVSRAKRASQSARIVRDTLQLSVELHYDPTLYLATPDGICEALQRCEAEARTLLLIGHNPGLSEWAQQLSARCAGACAPGGAIELKTAGVVRFDLAADSWRDIRSCGVSARRVLC